MPVLGGVPGILGTGVGLAPLLALIRDFTGTGGVCGRVKAPMEDANRNEAAKCLPVKCNMRI